MVLEIWNLVFMQFNREADRSLRTLPNKHIDTGMGLERLVSILQDKTSNYDTDVFTPLFDAIKLKTGARAYTGFVGAEDVDGLDTAYRVVADHLRTLTFAISDGGTPSNEGRGYVLRRVLRRGSRYVRKKFNVPIGSFFSSLVDTLVAQMGEAFPEITKRVSELKEILDEEESSFAKTLDRGEVMFEKFVTKALATGKTQLSGADVWMLYDTYGFPVDLTEIMAEERNFTLDMVEFESEQIKAKERSRASKNKTGTAGVALDVHTIAEIETLGVAKTDDRFKYEHGSIHSNVKAIFKQGAFVKAITSEEFDGMFGIVTDKTNFYAVSGGQEFDTGSITIDGECEFTVENVQVFGGYVLHIGYLKYGSLHVGNTVISTFDEV